MPRKLPVGHGTETVSVNLATATAALRLRRLKPRPVVVLTHLERAQVVALDEPITVGRDDTADVTIADRSLSREHARFERRGDDVFVADLGSTNGIWVAGRRVDGEARVPIDAEVTLGRVVASIRSLGVEPRQRRVLEDHEQFREAVAEEIRRAHFFRRHVSLVHLRLVGAPQTPLRRWFADVQTRLRSVDRVAAYSGDTLTALLPEVSLEELTERFVEMRVALAEALPTAQLIAGAATYPSSAASAEELRQRARDALAQARVDDPFLIAQMTPHRSYNASTSQAAGLGFVAENSDMVRLTRYASRIAPSPLPVLIIGERGSGKETMARFVHSASDRASSPLVAVQCKALTPGVQESLLFGHRAGAFEGAQSDEAGLLRASDGQTVFFDDVDELALPAQVGLLRLIEQGTILPLGATRAEPADIRVLCASSQPLGELVEEGRFSGDLLERLEVIKLVVPPLRERRQDIPALVATLARRQELPTQELDPAALRLLAQHDWPGNLRELQNVLDRASVMARGGKIMPEQLPLALAPSDAEQAGLDLREEVERLEISLLEQALSATDGDLSRAAAWLKVPLRTLLDKLKTYNIRAPRRRRR